MRLGEQQSIWMVTASTPSFPRLDRDLKVDVVVLGGGITGLSTALELRNAGLEVALLEARQMADGMTGHTTSKVTMLHGLIYDQLIRAFGKFVRWNNAERSWDCPCHGSRYTPDGSVIHGPAVKDLKRLNP